MKNFVYGMMFWLAAAGGWILLTFTADYQEAVASVIVGAMATIYAAAMYKYSKSNFTVPERWAGPVARLMIKVVSDTGVVMGALFRQITQGGMGGEMIQQPFDPGGPDTQSAARRALVEAGVSLTPNSVAVDVDDRRGVMLIHQLMPSSQRPESKDPEWPL